MALDMIPAGNGTAKLEDIRAKAREISQASPLLTTGMQLTSWQRAELRDLATMCGVEAHTHANDADLISIYLVAKRDGVAARRTAERIAKRLDETFFPAPVLREPWEDATPAPRKDEPEWLRKIPLAPEPPREDVTPGLTHDRVRAIVRDEIKGGVLDPIQAALEQLASQFGADLEAAKVEARVDTLDAVRGEIEKAAHAAAAEALRAMQPVRLEVVTPDQPEPIKLGLVHRKTPMIINALSAGVNVYLHGPAGSGKTTCARKAAEALSVAFHFAAKVESEYQLMGFKDAKGETVRTPFREAYEFGGCFLFDEMDASSPSAVVALNAALANGICPFPDKVVERHKNFYCIGAGNTKLTGATRAYAGRTQLDAASIDRFAFIEFGYDDDLELALAADVSWAKYVQSVRKAIASRGLTHLVTPRATYDGCKLLAAGFDLETVKGMVVYKGLDADTVRQIEQAL